MSDVQSVPAEPVLVVTIVMKGGGSVTFRCVKFEYDNGRYKWRNAPGNGPHILKFDANEVAAVTYTEEEAA